MECGTSRATFDKQRKAAVSKSQQEVHHLRHVTFLAKWFLLSACIGVLIGALIVGIEEADTRLHLHATFNPVVGALFLFLAPGIITGLGMPPPGQFLFTVCSANFLLYGVVGLLIGVFVLVLSSSGPSDPAIIKKGR